MNKTPLLELAKKLNIPRRNCMKTKEELKEDIKDTITRYKEIIFGSDAPLPPPPYLYHIPRGTSKAADHWSVCE